MAVRGIRLALVVALAATAWGQSRPPAGEREAAARAVSTWNSSCDGGDRASWDDMAFGWYLGMTLPGFAPADRAWTPASFQSNGNIADSDFTDVNLVSYGRDHTSKRADDVDAMLIALHGSVGDDDRWVGSVRVDESGDGNCVTWQGGMLFGNNADLEFLHLSSCFSMSRRTWWPEWTDSFSRIHQIDGFHGLMFISSSYVEQYTDFAMDAYYIPIACAWYDNMYHANTHEGQDQCPVARGAGLSESGLWTRMWNEEYDWVYSDPSNPPYHGTIYISGCDPKSDDPLP